METTNSQWLHDDIVEHSRLLDKVAQINGTESKTYNTQLRKLRDSVASALTGLKLEDTI